MSNCKNCNGNTEIRFKDFARIEYCPYCGYSYPATYNDYELKVQSAYNYFQVQAERKKYDDLSFALSRFEDIIKLNPSDPRGWWGKVLCMTKNLTLKEYDSSIIEFAQRAFDLAPESNKQSIKEKWNNYADIVNKYLESNYNRKIAEVKAENERIVKEHKDNINKVIKKRNFLIISRIVGVSLVVIYNIIAFSILVPMVPQRISYDVGVVGAIIAFVFGDWVISVLTGLISKCSYYSWFPPVLSGVCTIEAIAGMFRGGFFVIVIMIVVFGAIGAGITAAANTSYVLTSKFSEKLSRIPVYSPNKITYPEKYKLVSKL